MAGLLSPFHSGNVPVVDPSDLIPSVTSVLHPLRPAKAVPIGALDELEFPKEKLLAKMEAACKGEVLEEGDRAGVASS